MQDFRHIRAWQRAHALSIAIHKRAGRFTPGKFGHLRAQLLRSAASIGDNIVEGCGCDSKLDFAKFLDSSIKSANETETQLLTARDLSLLSPNEWQRFTQETVEIRKVVFGYRNRVLRSARDGE